VIKWLLLAAAIGLEVTGTLSLRASDGFSKTLPAAVTVVTYIGSFTMLGQVLKAGMPVGVAYGVWAGTGVALVAILGRMIFGDPLTGWMAVGFALIIAGVLLVEFGRPHASA
jgi:small multidrug resistance pump